MKEINWWKVAVIAIVALALFWGGFFIGKQREPEVITNTVTEYVELPPIHDTIPVPKPYKVVEPADTVDIIKKCIENGLFAELFPPRPDTVFVTKEDTSAVIKDWATQRHYAETLFDIDTVGKCSINADVQYNRLSNLSYEFIPIQKQTQTTIRTTRTFLPYVGAGLSTNATYSAQGGVFYKQDAGVAIQYNYNGPTKQSSVGAMFMWMF
jgi:hypothetical protein